MNIDIIAGARPNFMKIAPIIHAIQKKQKENININFRLIHTGQHFDQNMSGSFFDQLQIPEPNINLGAGAELGIYTGDNFQKNVNTRLAMPMRLTLSYNGAEIINYHPTAEQWWITGFNSNYMRVKACDLTATFSVRFTDQEMYDAFYGTWNNREQDGCRWVFDGTTCTATLRF